MVVCVWSLDETQKGQQRHRRDLTFARAYTNNKSYLFFHLEWHAASDAAEKWSDGRVAWGV